MHNIQLLGPRPDAEQGDPLPSTGRRQLPSLFGVDCLAAFVCHADDQLAVAQADVEFAADGEAELFQPAAT